MITGSRRRRRRLALGVAILVVLALPVPWLHATGDDPAGFAWRLDGRLVVEGEVMNPTGRWSWLTVGRPPVVAELLRDRLVGTDSPPRDMRVAPPGAQPVFVEPVAAAVGLLHGGAALELGLVVEAHGALLEGLPDPVVIVSVDGVELRTRSDWMAASAGAGPAVQFRTADGQVFQVPGPLLPYERIRVIDVGPTDFAAAIGGPSRFRVVEWFRSLALGNSHGMMVALVTYAHYADMDLAQGRHIAGTGGILGDGTVTRIGGLVSKARAARRAGADVLFFPASQADQLADFDPRGMALVGVNNLAEAIAYLLDTSTPATASPGQEAGADRMVAAETGGVASAWSAPRDG